MKQQMMDICPCLATAQDLDGVMTVIQKIVACPDKDQINQWDESYPTREIFAKDIENGSLYIYRLPEPDTAYMTPSPVAGLFTLMEDMDYLDNARWTFPGPFLVLHRFCVTPDLHGRGVARGMLDYIAAHAAYQGYKAVRLDTYSGNIRSNRLYTAAGYRFSGVMQGRKGMYNCYEKAIGPHICVKTI